MNRLSSLASSDSSHPQPLTKLHVEEALAESSAGGCGPSLSSFEGPLGNLLKPKIRRTHRFFVPVRYEAAYRYPLIVWLHSDGYNEHQISHVMPHISTRNFVGVGIRGSQAMDPSGSRFVWAQTPAAISRCEDAVWQAIDDACDRYSIHPERIFLAGYGEGGTMARRIALQRSSQFAGCISLGGRMPRGNSVLGNMHRARKLNNLWAVAMNSRSMTDEQFEDDIRLAADARLRFEVRRYTVEDEMVTEVLRDVNVWAMRIVTGEADAASKPAAPDWATIDVQFSSN
jgi:phospholipase/carboxylesterase